MLKVENLRVSYGDIEAVHGVSLEVGGTQLVSVIGANGAGKTSLLGALMGGVPASGSIVSTVRRSRPWNRTTAPGGAFASSPNGPGSFPSFRCGRTSGPVSTG